MMGIYEIVYKGVCVYVGSSINIKRRFAQHKNTLRRGLHRNFILQRMWDKNKNENIFVFNPLMEVKAVEELSAWEKVILKLINPPANLTDHTGVYLHTAEAKQKMKGAKSPEHLANLRVAARKRRGVPNGRKGVKSSEETIQKLKIAHQGQVAWNKGLSGTYSTSYRGSKLSEEHKKKLSLAKLGKPKPESARLALIGRKLSAEHKLRISNSLRKHYATSQ